MNKQENKSIVVLTIVLITFFVLLAIFSPAITKKGNGDPFIIKKHGESDTPEPPNKQAPWGTTSNQFDIYYGCVWGTKTAFTLVIPIILGITLIGSIAGLFIGYFDSLLGLLSKSIFIVLSIFSIISASYLFLEMSRTPKYLILESILFFWPLFSLVVCGKVSREKRKKYIKANELIGSSNLRTIFRHLLPNLSSFILKKASLAAFFVFIGIEALSALGIVLEYGYADWGSLIYLSRNYLELTNYWVIVPPTIFIFIFALTWVLLSQTIEEIGNWIK